MDINVLYEDSHVIVAVKPSNLISESTPDQKGFADLLSAHTNGYIGTVHRLDHGVGGVMVYAKTPSAASKLSAQLQQHLLRKEYLAVVHGVPSPSSDSMSDLLFHDRNKNKTFVVDRERAGVKHALLDYVTQKTVESDTYGTISLVRVILHTGRTHQLRLHMASVGCPLTGDWLYGTEDRALIARPALHSYILRFIHPLSGEALEITAPLPQDMRDLLEEKL